MYWTKSSFWVILLKNTGVVDISVKSWFMLYREDVFSVGLKQMYVDIQSRKCVHWSVYHNDWCSKCEAAPIGWYGYWSKLSLIDYTCLQSILVPTCYLLLWLQSCHWLNSLKNIPNTTGYNELSVFPRNMGTTFLFLFFNLSVTDTENLVLSGN